MLPNCDGEQARKLSERLRQAVADTPMNAEGNELHITCSLGVAFTDTPNGIGVAALVYAADEALYRAKQRLGSPSAQRGGHPVTLSARTINLLGAGPT